MINAYEVRGGHVLLRHGSDLIIKTEDGREVGVMFSPRGELSFTIANNPPPENGFTYDATGPRVIYASEHGWYTPDGPIMTEDEIGQMREEAFEEGRR